MAEKKSDYKPTYDADESTLMSIYTAYRREAEEARLSRIQQNKVNFDVYHMRQDYSYKQKGQSQEFLPKLSMAVEQSSAFLTQALVDMGDWFRIYPAPGLSEDDMKIKPSEIQKILTRQLEKCRFMTQVGDAVKLGFLGSLMIAKVHGRYVPKNSFKVESKLVKGTYKKKLIKTKDKKWQLQVDLVRQQDWRPDPTGLPGLYRIQDVYVDWHELKQMAEGENPVYDIAKVMELKAQSSLQSALQEYEKSRETGQNLHNTNFRHRIKLSEIWGNFATPDGELVWENCVATIANDLIIVQKPTSIALWHGSHPYVSTPILTVPHSVWGKTPMDAGALLNIAINELFNLILDGGLAAVHGIKQIRENWLEDPSQVEDGIPPGETLRVNTSCPPGANVLDRVDTTTVPAEALPIYNLLVQEFSSAVMTDDLRMGVQPFRQVKATEIVESSQAINSSLSAIAKHIESDWIKEVLEKAWLTCAQHLNDFDDRELKVLLGDKRAAEILKMGPEELFAETAGAIKFEVFGISETLNKQKEFTKLQAMLQTLVSQPVLMEEFTKKYDFGKLLTEILKSLDVPIYKIQNDEALNNPITAPKPPMANGMPSIVPNSQSQIPQAGAAGNQASDTPASLAQPNFPPSRALAVEGR